MRVENTRTAGPRRVLVTGGAGFLGRALLEELRKAPQDGGAPPEEIRVYDLRPLEPEAVDGVTSIVGDVRDFERLLEACHDVDVVVHAASLVDFGHATDTLLDSVNITGTENTIRACRAAGVRALIHTSSMDVVYAGRPVVDGDETLAYPERFADTYARSKAIAEQAVVRANGTPRTARPGENDADARLRTCVIRPCGMYGEADPYHVSNVLRMLQAGKLAARIGSGKAVFQHVYVGNVAHAHVLAVRNLLEPDPPAAGEIYLVTDFPAINFFDFMEPIMRRLGHPMPSRRVPFPIVFALGTALEFASTLCRPFFSFQPTLTRSSVRIVCQDFCFVGDKAVRDLGYKPIYSEAESLDRTVEYFRRHGPLLPPAPPEEV